MKYEALHLQLTRNQKLPEAIIEPLDVSELSHRRMVRTAGVRVYSARQMCWDCITLPRAKEHPMAANYSEAEMRAFIAAQVAAGLVAGLSLGPKSSNDEFAKIAETAVRIAKAIHDASVQSVQISEPPLR